MKLINIDPKALEHACQCASRSVHHFDRMALDLPLRASIVAHARAIEQHEAFRQEVSDAIQSCMLGPVAEERLSPFIIPKPVDPLVEALREVVGDGYTLTEEAKALRTALAKRNAKIVWEAE